VIDAHAPKAKEFPVTDWAATGKAGSRLKACFRPLSIREEGTLHPVGLVAVPVVQSAPPVLDPGMDFSAGCLNARRSAGSSAVHQGPGRRGFCRQVKS
ncbi:hypothetical protein, partial [Mesorhizobium sp. M7A.F.Ca.US.002.01.1.1]|uniref:hypothetical protein n=1 Tax=Mesorhizobium sp. M7A.F.Ca.US.002.01.1.1 TaxID=2496700 RepID=UPI0019D4A77C